MVQSREVVYLDDFTGGLNLTAQLQSLGMNETPDCLNVDFGLRGGFTLRGGFQSQEYDSLINGASFLCATYFSNDVVLMEAADGSLLEWNGSSISDTTEDLTDDTDFPVRATSFNSKAYFANGRDSGAIEMRSWDGSTLTTLANTYNDNYSVPAGGAMPKARLVTSHNGYLWVADTVESSTRYPHRLRFSHVQQPEDWAVNDYFDIDPGDDGDPITAIVSFREQLIVFKTTGVYAVFGYSREEFFWEKLTSASGVSNPESVTYNSGVLYWFDEHGQVMAYNGRSAAPLTQGLRWWTDIGKIDVAGEHHLMWARNRLWMSLSAGSSEDVDRWLFVYDPTIKALTRYDKVVSAMFEWHRLDTEPDALFVFDNDQNFYRFDRSYTVDTVDAGAGPVSTRIDGYYRTSWVTAGETATRKRWKRPRVTAAASADTTIRMEVYHDFVEEVLVKFSDIVIETGGSDLWGTMDWGDEWSAGFDDYYEFARQPSAGSGRAIQFKFSSGDNPGRWWVDSIAVPFRRKQVK